MRKAETPPNNKLKKAKKSFFKEMDGHNKHVVKIYRSLEDFVIGESIDPNDIVM